MDGVLPEYMLRALMENSYVSSSSGSESTSSLCSVSSEETPKKRRKLHRILKYIEDTVHKYDDIEFKIHFRMARQTVYKVIDLLEESHMLPSYAKGRENISAEKSFLLVLWYMCNQETFRQVSDRFNVTFSTAHRCLQRVVAFLLSIKSQIIKWPTGDKIDVIVSGFEARQGIPNVLGVIDGSHIEIAKPKENQDSYVNRKGYHSLLLQGIVNHRKQFMDVFCGEPAIYYKSAIYAKMHVTPDFMERCFLLGDSAYPNLHWLVTPYKDNNQLTQQQRMFNYKHSATRVIVENAFGLLKGRFRRLRKLDNLDIALCAKLIMSACILHNICIDYDDLIDCEDTDYNQPGHISFNSKVYGAVEQTNRQLEVLNTLVNINQLQH